jgi:hypothetical protein
VAPTYLVMAGLVPAIHVFLAPGTKDVDARHKAGHDELICCADSRLAHFPCASRIFAWIFAMPEIQRS